MNSDWALRLLPHSVGLTSRSPTLSVKRPSVVTRKGGGVLASSCASAALACALISASASCSAACASGFQAPSAPSPASRSIARRRTLGQASCEQPVQHRVLLPPPGGRAPGSTKSRLHLLRHGAAQPAAGSSSASLAIRKWYSQRSASASASSSAGRPSCSSWNCACARYHRQRVSWYWLWVSSRCCTMILVRQLESPRCPGLSAAQPGQCQGSLSQAYVR